MRTQSEDTHPSAEEVQISLIRRSSVAERVARAFSLSETVIALSRRAIARANPDLDEKELNLRFVEYHYGEDLAQRLREYLEGKSP